MLSRSVAREPQIGNNVRENFVKEDTIVDIAAVLSVKLNACSLVVVVGTAKSDIP